MSSHWEVVGQLSNSHKAVIKKLLSGSYQGVVRQSGGSCQAFNRLFWGSCYLVVRKSLDSFLTIIKQPSSSQKGEWFITFCHYFYVNFVKIEMFDQ